MPRLVLLTVDTELNGTMCSEPSPARKRTVRIDRFSTVPETPATVTQSPTCMAFSMSRKMPVMKSWTSFCEPKPSATPMMLAPASSGVVLMPISLRAVMPTISRITIINPVRSIGSNVRSRAARISSPLSLQRAMRRSSAALVSCQTTSARITATTMVIAALARLRPIVPAANQPIASKPQA